MKKNLEGLTKKIDGYVPIVIVVLTLFVAGIA
jgi:hypothetical protein